jgi:hypothetical protein
VSGDPTKAAAALLTVVDAADPPLRVILGGQAAGIARGIYERRLTEWAKWESVSVAAQD